MVFQNENEILKLLQPIINEYKKADSRLARSNKIKDLPEFYPGYRKAVEYSERIKVHAKTGYGFPEELFFSRSPHMTEKEYKWMKENYKQTTSPVFIDYLSTNTRCFNDGNWNIYYKEDKPIYEKSGETFQEYVEKKIMGVDSLENFIKSIVATMKSIDAHGAVAIKPKEVYFIADELTQETIIDDSILVEPQPFCYSSRQVLSDSKYDAEYFILECNEKTSVVYGAKTEKKGHIFEVYDEDTIWRIEQIGKFTDYQFKVYRYFTHMKGSVPVKRLMGIPQMEGDSLLWASPFLSCCDLLDLALMNRNYLNASLSNTMFPYRVMLGSKCEFDYKNKDGLISRCNEGYVFDSELERNITCPHCKGSAGLNRVSPMGEMLIFPKDLFNDGDGGKMVANAMYYVEPSTEGSKLIVDVIKSDTAIAYDVIKAKPASQSTGKGITGDGSATASILDSKAQLAVVKTFSDQLFSLYEFIGENIGWQRYGKDFEGFVLSYPSTFDFNTEQDYLSQITQAQNAKLAPFIIHHIIFKYLTTLYYNEKQTAQIFKLILASDRLLVMSQTDVLLQEKMGDCLKWEVILHNSAIQFVDELIDENADAEMCADNDCSRGFFALDFAEQKRLLIEKAKAKVTEIDAALPDKQAAAVAGALSA